MNCATHQIFAKAKQEIKHSKTDAAN
jgi:hypothetical protein